MRRGVLCALVCGIAAAALTPATASAVSTCTTPPVVEVRQDAGRTVYPDCGPGMYPFVIETAPAHGQLVGVPFSLGTARRYVPDAGYLGADSFSYAVDGPGGHSNVVTQALVVNTTANLAPACRGPLGTTVVREGEPKTLTVTCSDDDGDPIALTVADPQPAFGDVTITPGADTGSFDVRYETTNPGGAETVTLTAADDHSTSTTVAFAVDAVTADADHVPVCTGYARVVGPWEPLGVSVHSCSDADGDPLTIEPVDPPAHGTLTVSAAGDAIEYHLADDAYRGTDRFTFRAADGRGGFSAPAALDITIRDPTAPPSGCHAVSGDVYADTDTQVIISCFPGDDGLPLTYTIDTPPAHGTLRTWAGQGYLYRPEAGYTGPDSFAWHATGPHGLVSGPQLATFVVSTPPSAGGGAGGGGGGVQSRPVTPEAPQVQPRNPPAPAPLPVERPHAASDDGRPGPALRPAGLELGPATAYLAPGARTGTVFVAGRRRPKLLVIECSARCRVVARAELLLGARRRAAAASARRVRLPRQRLRLRAGHRGTVALRLNRAGRRALRRHRAVRIRLIVTVRSAGGATARDRMAFRVRLRR